MDQSEGVNLGEPNRAVAGGGVRAAIARRWKWPVRIAALCGAAATVFGLCCPLLMEREDRLLLVVTHAACMLRTFGLQCGIGALIGALAAWAIGLKRSALLGAVAATAWLAPEAWKWVHAAGPVVPQGRETLTVLSINALYGRSRPDAVERAAAGCGADVIVFQEYTPELASALRPALSGFLYRVESPRDDGFGQAVYSKRPFAGQPRVYLPWSRQPQITAVVQFDGEPLSITDVHLMAPGGLALVAEQRKEITGLAQELRTGGAAGRILMGDFNATMDGGMLTPLVGAGLHESWRQAGRGRGGTWPVGVPPLSALGKIRIDNAFHGDGLVCVASGVGEATGSDHFPIWCRFVRAH